MSVRSGQTVVTVFPLNSGGAATDADVLPTATLYVSGVANAAVVTITRLSTGLYTASVVLPALATSDVVSIVVSATVSGVAGKGKVWEDSVLDAAIDKIKAATYDSAAAAGNVLTLSNGKTQTIDATGRTTSP